MWKRGLCKFGDRCIYNHGEIIGKTRLQVSSPSLPLFSYLLFFHFCSCPISLYLSFLILYSSFSCLIFFFIPFFSPIPFIPPLVSLFLLLPSYCSFHFSLFFIFRSFSSLSSFSFSIFLTLCSHFLVLPLCPYLSFLSVISCCW
jgi:hypothetical protein